MRDRRRTTFSLGVSSAFGVFALTGVFASAAHADNVRVTLAWESYDEKDPLTDRVVHEVIGEATFPDGSLLQTTAKCAPDAGGKAFPGVSIQVATFKKGGQSSNPFAWQNGSILLPILINERPTPGLHAYSENPRANIIPIGFYDPAAAERFTRLGELPMMDVEVMQRIAKRKQEAAWENFTSQTGGTFATLLKATSVRVQLPLADGSANVVELNPQDSVLKSFVQDCNDKLSRKAGAR
jgi:hypothetical protein